MAEKLRKSLEETTKDVENIKKEIKRKKKDIHRSLKHYVQAEKSLKQANFKMDTLEMDNYNLRENFNEQVKTLEEYKGMVSELQSLSDMIGEKPLENA